LAEQAIQRSEQRLRAVFDNAGVGILEADSKDRFIAANPRVCEILDYDRQELVGMSVHELTAPEDRPRSDELNAQLHEGRFGRFDTDKRYLRPDGTALWLHVTVSGVRDLAGRHAGAIATIEDISGRKQAEDALGALNVTLEERVAERTAVAEHRAAQLRELASMLTQTEQKERRRVAHILHEHFQQLLFAVQLQLGQLKGQLKDKNMTDIADKAEHILAEGIDVSRTLAVEMYPPVLYSLGLLPALDWLAAKMKDKYGLGVKVTADPEAEPVTDASKTLLFDSTSELLFNVVKHAKVKTAGVTVKRLGDRVEITVADKGVGFDPAMLPEREGAAGGFGLFSIRERLDVMGGRLEIESAPGQGSRFRITAPVGETPPVQVEALLPTVPAATSGVTAALGSNGAAVVAQRKIRVMLVDDHAIVRQGISLALKEAQDIEVAAEAADGSIAVDIVHKILPDVVLMDISMPVMDGIEATRIIHQQHPDVRIIGLSMFEESEQSAAMRKAGACAYLTKSGDFNALLATIRTWSPVPAGNAANQREEK
jgi:PAS domain S-box-containing protein